MEVKQCSVCGKEFEADMFYTDKSKSSGLDTRCKFCHNLYQKRNYKPEEYLHKLKNTIQQIQYMKQVCGLKFNLYGKKKNGARRDLCNFTCLKCGKEFHRKSVFGLAMRKGLCTDCFKVELTKNPSFTTQKRPYKRKPKIQVTEPTQEIKQEPIRVEAEKKIAQEPISQKTVPNIGEQNTFFVYDPNTKNAVPVRFIYVPVEKLGCSHEHCDEHKPKQKKGIWSKIKSIFS